MSLRSIVNSLAVLSLSPLPAVGQEVGASPPVPPRVASLTAGLGNVMGWFGLHGERYFARERLSGFVGLGYTPSVDEGDPSGPTFAIGLRGFTTGIKHRGFLALSLSQLALESGFVENPRRFYGPGLEAGYQYVAGADSPSWHPWGLAGRQEFPKAKRKSVRSSLSAWATPGGARASEPVD